jgi:CheY-like chemotaxis protein
LSRLLRAAGHEVVCAGDGPEGLAAVGRRAPDVIVLDLSMPAMDGGEFLRRLRSDPRRSNVPVLLLSALADAELRQLAERHSAFGAFSKLVMDCDGLLAAVAEASGKGQADRPSPADAASPPRPPA